MRVNYTVKGQGPSLVLLHGWGGSIESLANLQDKLAELGYQVFNLDLPGFGQTTAPERAMNLDDYVEFMRQFCESLNIFKPVFIGHSFGGKISAAYSIKYPDLLSRLVLVDASGINPRNSLKKESLKITAKVFNGILSLPVVSNFKYPLRKLFYRFVVKETDYLNSGTLKETFKNIIEEHLDERLVQIKQPTLLIWGENDTYTPLWHGQTFATKIPGARLEVVHGARHNLPLVEPDVVAKIIYSFLNVG